MSVRLWGGPVTVNQTTTNGQTDPDVATLADGRMIVVWEDESTIDTRIMYRIFNSDGTPAGDEILVSSFAGNDLRNPVVTALDNGGWVIGYDNSGGSGSDGFRAYDALGNNVISGAIGSGLDPSFPEIINVGNEYWVVAVGSGADNPISVFRYNQDTGLAQGAFTAQSSTTGLQENPAGTQLTDGNVVIVWRESDEIEFRIFTSVGAAVTSDVLVTNGIVDADNGDWGKPHVLALDNGGFLITWSDGSSPFPGSGYDVWGQIYDPSGVAFGDTFLMNSTIAGHQFNPVTVALNNGGFALFYNTNVGLNEDVRGQLFDITGNRVGVEFSVTGDDVDGGFDTMDATALEDGRILVSFGQSDVDGSGRAIVSQIVDPRDGVVTGDAGDNTLYGSTSDDVIVASGGNDTVFAMAGNDQILGNSGDDTLNGDSGDDEIYGQGGNDTINGGPGADLMNGGIGDDMMFVNNIDDVIVEAVGEGSNDRVATNISYTLATGIEIELFTTTSTSGTNNLDLTGNAFAQTIIGNAGNNTISDGGGAGADALIGLGGDDFYIVRNAGTTIMESAAQGANDRVAAGVDYVLGSGVNIELLTTTSSGSTSSLDLTGNELAQTIIGNAGDNLLRGGGAGGDDTFQGLGGDDNYRVYNAGDTIIENSGQGDDRVYTSVDYVLGAGVDIETFTTNSSAGTASTDLTGNELAQLIIGNAGNNRIDGKDGADTLRGLGGDDIFGFSTALGSSNIDTVIDFNVADDTIELEDAIFTAIVQAPGTMLSGYFKANTAGVATDANDRIIYDTDDGLLLYDADGNGAGAAILFTILTTGLALTFNDFEVV